MPILAKKRTSLPFGLLFFAMLLSACGREQRDTTAHAASAPGADRLKVAFVYAGPVSDGGWSYAHDLARRSVEAELGDRVATTYVENVADGVDAEKVFRDLAGQGNRVIFGTSFGYMEPMLKVAKEFPEVKFEHATGHKTAENVSVYEARTYEGAYLAGVLAGKASRTGRLGFVASVPIPEVIRNINAFTLGAQSVNPAATTRVAWVHRWFDMEREREAALDLIGGGADVLIQNTDSPAVLKAAQEKGVHAFGWDSDMTQYGPKAHLGSAVIDWSPYYKKVVNSVLDGTWQSGAVWWGARQNMVRIASPNPELAHDVLLFLGEKTHALKTGKLRVFGGPVLDLNGKEVIAAGQEGDDAWLKGMNFFVKGVLGEIPR